jgi:hypothetical protein
MQVYTRALIYVCMHVCMVSWVLYIEKGTKPECPFLIKVIITLSCHERKITCT